MRPNEIRQLTWEMFDRETGTLNLDPRAAKTRQGRVLAVAGPLRTIVKRRLAARRRDCRLIFHRTSKGKVGQPVKDSRRAWAAACKAAGLPAGRKVAGGVTPYVLRRCAVRNVVRGGTHETVAMKITGHQDALDVRPEQHRERGGSSRRDGQDATYVASLPTERKVERAQDVHSRDPHRRAR
jgi:integrase